jgi:stage IV sporulation protein FB
VTLSLLVHELGHALVARHYRLRPHILLHGFGGVTGHERARTNGQDALIVAAGPASGLALAGLCWLGLTFVQVSSYQALWTLGLMLELNLYWSLFNLLPMWPMDGGQLMRLGASKIWQPARGERITHIVSIVVVVLVAFWAFTTGYGLMMLFILAFTAWQNVQALSNGPSQPQVRDNPRARELWREAEAAHEAGRDDDAVRLCHQLRSEPNVPPAIMAKAWAVLGVSATRKHDYEEALSYLRRAPDQPDVVESTAQCFYQLGMFDALEALMGTRAFARLPSDTRDAIQRAVRDAPQG